ncbi:flagellar hook protein FlgE [Vreelandella titanicae]|jgi:flagellar hook protein FlgE|uniref:Flagellar hook protein FlgE n=1 Tax=Vreelandella titanicae BH1 TaxID=1204738 RepID=L9U632_9GAMM|nr:MULTISPECIES: flagellar hook protein FlgE [Halomonas]NAO98894.1 flagellar hook-basal body complex protein [Halomonas sp. MG34]QGQ69014.1 flagellar hook protein FlgE [Halomonas sp. PA16-9]ELY20329.1 flagellar hook-basal body protein, FlgE/F/G [Halomonas titanicae BH1]NVE92909.1 flagellar hook protein FlgE [Halomonas titanicae]PKH62323.1 flagellar hook protein FlgE [Halomonas sp. Choline-3u-9]|tara:strand:+ start:1644 stop:2915 length:1272 start_codon:yes stop_codon:yes gene_type:complete
MSFSQALSGLSAQQQKLGAVGNNIANSQTVGFKSSSVQFADVYAESRIGLGVRTSTVLQNFSGGNIESTNRNMDLAISGEGFFRFQQPNGEVGYSRNGQLTMTADGRLVNAQGAQIMGYAADANGDVQAGGDVTPLTVDSEALAASATNELSVEVNLDSGEAGIDTAAAGYVFDPTDNTTYSFSTNATVYDSQGNARNLSMYFIKDDAAPNQWQVQGRLTGGPSDAEAYNFDLGTLAFDTNGRLVDGAPTAINDIDSTDAGFNVEGAGANEFGPIFTDLNIAVDFQGSTQFAEQSDPKSISQNGYSSGSLVGITIEDDGTVMRNYANEQSRAAGQVALASFRNPEGLKPEGNNLWTATGSSGQELVGAPGTGLRGLIEPSAVETSNVDMARELVDMIVAQRAYQANSQTISTQDELLQTIINL